MAKSSLLGIVLALGVGCASPPIGSTVPEIQPVTVLGATPHVVAPTAAIVREIAVAADTTGVAIDGDRRLTVSSAGVITDLDSGATLWAAIAPEPPFGFTDLVALGPGRLALTSVGDGFVVELEDGSMYQHFCYEPGWMDPNGQNPVQVSLALARDPLGGRLYAQPRTIEEGGIGAVTASFVSAYDEEGGADLAWWALPIDFVAGGMAVLPTRDGDAPRLLLGAGSLLHRFDVATGELRASADLSELGIGDVQGLALDARADTLLVLHGARVVELRMSALEI